MLCGTKLNASEKSKCLILTQLSISQTSNCTENKTKAELSEKRFHTDKPNYIFSF